jgi:hypothetical protein
LLDDSIQLNTSTKGNARVTFGKGGASSIGSVLLPTSIGKVEFHIVEANILFLLSLPDMYRLKTYPNILINAMVTPHGNVPLVLQFRHLFLI